MKRENRVYTELEKSYDAERIDFFNKEFFRRDMKILLDFSMFYVKKFMSIVYSNVFFGNTLYITQQAFRTATKMANGKIHASESDIRNCKLFLNFLENDRRNKIEIVKLEDQDVVEYVKSNEHMILYVSSANFFYEAQYRGARVKLYDKHCGVYNERSIKYDTLGILLFDEENNMYIPSDGSKPGTTKRVFSSWFKEKYGDRIKVRIGDYVVIRKEKPEIITLVIYRIVNYHSRNNAIKLLWTDIYKGETKSSYANYPELQTLIEMNLYN